MKLIYTILLFVSLFFQLSCSQKNITSGGKTYTVLVGISDYEIENELITDLRYADDDAEKLFDFFTSRTGAALQTSNTKLILNKQATKENIVTSVAALFKKAEPQDRVIFYFSGHGIQNKLIPHDSDATTNMISYQEIKTLFSQSKAQTKLCIIDACNAGSVKYSPKKVKDTSQTSSNKAKVAVMVSSRLYQKSLEHNQLGQGIFSYYLIEGLKGEANTNKDSIIDITELHRYVFQNVKKHTDSQQIPETFGSFDTDMPVVVFR